jgi:hypothetical protein
MEVLVQSLQTFASPPEFTGYSLVPSDQAVDLSLKPKQSAPTVVSLSTTISSFANIAIPKIAIPQRTYFD